jgi:hypothetical protein
LLGEKEQMLDETERVAVVLDRPTVRLSCRYDASILPSSYSYDAVKRSRSGSGAPWRAIALEPTPHSPRRHHRGRMADSTVRPEEPERCPGLARACRRSNQGRAPGIGPPREATSRRHNRRGPTGCRPDRAPRRKWRTTNAPSVRNGFRVGRFAEQL